MFVRQHLSELTQKYKETKDLQSFQTQLTSIRKSDDYISYLKEDSVLYSLFVEALEMRNESLLTVLMQFGVRYTEIPQYKTWCPSTKPLLIIAKNNQTEIFDLFLKSYNYDSIDLTPLAKYNRVNFIAIVEKYFKIDNHVSSMAERALEYGQLEMLVYLLNNYYQKLEYSLIPGVMNDHTYTVRELVSDYVDAIRENKNLNKYIQTINCIYPYTQIFSTLIWYLQKECEYKKNKDI